ncbi:MAG: hypothetical protein GY701_19045 [Sulfitobacter sp.]|nr:hypothetical protein [Sulfitobacter sp.]MCP4080618.1 hypothetical protein [Planctomycetaceae bacterium]
MAVLGVGCGSETGSIGAASSVVVAETGQSAGAGSGGCGSFLLDDVDPPDRPFTFKFESSSTTPGSVARFSVEGDEGVLGLMGDETTVECWTGKVWTDAWHAVDLFGKWGWTARGWLG